MLTGAELVGTWRPVAVINTRLDGSVVHPLGPDPKGILVFEANGRFAFILNRPDLPRFSSNNRNTGTAEENKAVVQGSIAHFGHYTVNESERTITFHIENSTFPNWNGTDQTRPFTISDNTLKWVTPASTGGGSAEVVLERAR